MSKMGSYLLDQEEKGLMQHDGKQYLATVTRLAQLRKELEIQEVEMAELRGADVFMDLFSGKAVFDADVFFEKCREKRGVKA